MLTDHLRPGHLTYMQVKAEVPSALDAFVAYAMIVAAMRHAQDMNEHARDACDGPQDKALIDAWHGATRVITVLTVSENEAFRYLNEQLERAGMGDRYNWIQVKMRALELEAGVVQEVA